MSDDGNDKGGTTEVVKAKMMYPCPYCGKSGAGTPLKMFEEEEDLRKHLEEQHSDKSGPPTMPPSLIEALDGLLRPPQDGGMGCTSWTLVTVDRSGARINSSIIKGEGPASIEQMMGLEGLLLLLAENRAVMSGRAGPGPAPR